MDTDDAALVERCRNGDLSAFEPLVEKYRHRVWRLAYNVLRDREEAWDVAQEAFIRAYQALPSFRGQSQFYTWLYRIVVNVATDRGRSRAAQGRAFGTERVAEEDWERVLTDPAPGAGGESPDERATRMQDRERIVQALATLPEHHRTIIMLSDLEGLSYREIAETLDIPMGTVMSRLHNARKRLRAALGPLLVLVLAVLVALAASVAAQGPAGDDGKVVRFGARVLYGSDAPLPPEVASLPIQSDVRLRAFLPKLRQLFSYKEFTSLERYRAEVPVGTTQRWPVPGDRTLEVVPEAVSGETVRMRVRLLRGDVLELGTSILAARGSPAVIGGPRHGKGVLIVIVWANARPYDRDRQ